MRHFYVTKKSVLEERIANSENRHRDLFISVGGCHWVELGNSGYILLCCEELSTEDAAIWHAHPEVARMHSGLYPDDGIGLLVSTPIRGKRKNFEQRHLDALKKIGIKDEHTMSDISDVASAIHPLVKLSEVY